MPKATLPALAAALALIGWTAAASANPPEHPPEHPVEHPAPKPDDSHKEGDHKNSGGQDGHHESGDHHDEAKPAGH